MRVDWRSLHEVRRKERGERKMGKEEGRGRKEGEEGEGKKGGGSRNEISNVFLVY